MHTCFRYIKDNGGIDTETSYPYETKVGVCRYKPRNSGANDRGYVYLPRGDENALKKAVATIGPSKFLKQILKAFFLKTIFPVAIAMDSSKKSFQNYRSGVYYDPSCSSTEINHAVRYANAKLSYPSKKLCANCTCGPRFCS